VLDSPGVFARYWVPIELIVWSSQIGESDLGWARTGSYSTSLVRKYVEIEMTPAPATVVMMKSLRFMITE
jgi:hypothetical protein